jgi:DNA-binding NtrC family response regulator
VRELRNYLERCLVFEEPMPLGEDVGGPAIAIPPSLAASATGAASAVDPSVEYTEARRQALEAFERAYVRELLHAHGGRVSAAARAAGIGRVYLYRLMRRHGVAGARERGEEEAT